MLEIKTRSVILEMDRNDLWQIVTALKDGIMNASKLKWISYFQGESERDFIYYVRSNNHLVFKYLEEMYTYLERTDILESFESELITLFQNGRNRGG